MSEDDRIHDLTNTSGFQLDYAVSITRPRYKLNQSPTLTKSRRARAFSVKFDLG